MVGTMTYLAKAHALTGVDPLSKLMAIYIAGISGAPGPFKVEIEAIAKWCNVTPLMVRTRINDIPGFSWDSENSTITIEGVK